MVSAYFFTGQGAEAKNAELLEELLKIVAVLSLPWFLGVDGNQSPAVFVKNGWLEKTRATVAASGAATFNKGDQHTEIDFWILSVGLDRFVDTVRVVSNAPCSPHSPVELVFKNLDWHAVVESAVEWERFPTACPIGPRRHPSKDEEAP